MTDKIKIRPYTIKVQMTETSLFRKASEWYEAFATENNVELDIVDRAVSRFIRISSRVENLNGVADFELATPTDSADETRAKFEVYAESKQVALIETLVRKMQEVDKPINEDFAPDGLFEGED